MLHLQVTEKQLKDTHNELNTGHLSYLMIIPIRNMFSCCSHNKQTFILQIFLGKSLRLVTNKDFIFLGQKLS